MQNNEMIHSAEKTSHGARSVEAMGARRFPLNSGAGVPAGV